ncbi:MAG: hypothetical protein AAF492_21535, partial [Verrucomicrobiota bacterium]
LKAAGARYGRLFVNSKVVSEWTVTDMDSVAFLENGGLAYNARQDGDELFTRFLNRKPVGVVHKTNGHIDDDNLHYVIRSENWTTERLFRIMRGGSLSPLHKKNIFKSRLGKGRSISYLAGNADGSVSYVVDGQEMYRRDTGYKPLASYEPAYSKDARHYAQFTRERKSIVIDGVESKPFHQSMGDRTLELNEQGIIHPVLTEEGKIEVTLFRIP